MDVFFSHSRICLLLDSYNSFLYKKVFSGVINNEGLVAYHWYVSTLSFCLIIHVITIKLFLETMFWNVVNIALGIISLILFYLIIAFLSMNTISKWLQPEINGIFSALFGNTLSIIILCLGPFIIAFPDLMIKGY